MENAPKKLSKLKTLLGNIVFKFQGLRIGLELSACLVIYHFFVLISVGLGAPEEGFHLFTWFASCILVAIFDHLFIAAPVGKMKKTYSLENKSKYKEALTLLDSIMSGFIPCPADLYTERKLDILISAGQYEQANQLLKESVDLKDLTITRLKAKILAATDIEKAIDILGETNSGVLQLEKAFLIKKKDSKKHQIKNAFMEVIKSPAELHPTGESTHTLAFAYLQASRLWTGHAEEAFPALVDAIAKIRTSSVYMPALRPYLAELYAEKSYYLATHREPNKAMSDLAIAKTLSKHNGLKDKIATIEEELSCRYGIEVSQTEAF